MKKFSLLILLISALALNGHADAGNSYPASPSQIENNKLIELHQSVASRNPESYEAWYNLGNAYYETGQIGQSIAAYRNAYKLKPSDKDVQYNLEIAINKTKDKIIPKPRNVLVSITDSVADLFTEDVWAFICLLFAVFGTSAFLVYIFNKKYNIKKYGLISAVSLWLGSFGFLALAAHKYYYSNAVSEVVIVSPMAVITESPNSDNEVATYNEGSIFQLLETTENHAKIQLPDGREGYVQLVNVEVI